MAGSPRKTAFRLLAIVAVMGGLSFAAVPFYNWFCRVTGYVGVPKTADANNVQELDRMIAVRFDSNTDPALPWEFKPEKREIKLHIGETGVAFYTAHNTSDQPITGSATFNVTPYAAGEYFTKIACFCFQEQTLQPGESVEMPVTFYVDPEIVNDAEASYVNTITLSYTFYRKETRTSGKPAVHASNDRTGPAGENESGRTALD